MSTSHEVDISPIAPGRDVSDRLVLGLLVIPLSLAAIIAMAILWPAEPLTAEQLGQDEETTDLGWEVYTTTGSVVGEVEHDQYEVDVVLPDGSQVPANLSAGVADADLADGTRVQVASTIPPRYWPDLDADRDTGGPDEIEEIEEIDGAGAQVDVIDVDRTPAVWTLGVIALLLVLGVGRLRGALAALALAGSGAVLWFFTLPGLIAHDQALAVGAVSLVVIALLLAYVPGGITQSAAVTFLTLVGGGAVVLLAAMIVIPWTQLEGTLADFSFYPDPSADTYSIRGQLITGTMIMGLGIMYRPVRALIRYQFADPSHGAGFRNRFRSIWGQARPHAQAAMTTVVFIASGAIFAHIAEWQLSSFPAAGLIPSGVPELVLICGLIAFSGAMLALVLAAVLSAGLMQLRPAGPPRPVDDESSHAERGPEPEPGADARSASDQTSPRAEGAAPAADRSQTADRFQTSKAAADMPAAARHRPDSDYRRPGG